MITNSIQRQTTWLPPRPVRWLAWLALYALAIGINKKYADSIITHFGLEITVHWQKWMISVMPAVVLVTLLLLVRCIWYQLWLIYQRNNQFVYNEKILNNQKYWSEYMVLEEVILHCGQLNHDSFLDIRQELEKVSDIQLSKIEDAANYLCQNVGKDIRVAVYLTYVLFRREAFQGLIKGLLLIYGMQAIYTSVFQPQRITLIKTMLRWLGGTKMEDAFLMCQGTLLPSEYQVITILCELIQENFSAQFEATVDELNGLFSLLPVPAGETQAAINQTDSVSTDNNSNQSNNTNNDEVILRSFQDLMQTMKTVGQFIADKEQKPYASYRLLRQFRWDMLEQLPLHQDGLTKIPPPRQELINRLQTLYQRKEWSGLLEQCHAKIF